MSGETGVPKLSPRPNVATEEDTKENPIKTSDKDCDLANNADLPSEGNNQVMILPEADDVQEVMELSQPETIKLLEDEEMPTYTSISEFQTEEKKSEDKDDNLDKHSLHSCSTEGNLDWEYPAEDEDLDKRSDNSRTTISNSEDNSVNSDYFDKLHERNADEDLEKSSDDKMNQIAAAELEREEDEEEDIDEEDEDEIDDNNDYGDDDIQVVEDSVDEDEYTCQTNVERASSEDYEHRQNKAIKSEIEGKKSHSFQDLSNPNLLSEPKRISSNKQSISTVESNRIANPLKASYLKSLKPGPKSYHHVSSKVKQYIHDMKAKSAEDKRKNEELKVAEKRQSEEKELKPQHQLHPKYSEKQSELDKEEQMRVHEKLVHALQNEYARANSDHEKTFASLKPVPMEKQSVYEIEKVVHHTKDSKPSTTNRPFPPVDLTRSGVEIIRVKPTLEKMEVDCDVIVTSAKNNVNVNGATKDRVMDYQAQTKVSNGQQNAYEMSYKDYMRRDSKPNEELAFALAQERSKNAALKKQLDSLRKKESESKKLSRDIAVQTESPKTSDTSTSITEWSENPDYPVPSLDSSTQTMANSNLSQKLAYTFLTSSRILETFTTVSRELKKEDNGNRTLTLPNSRKRKIDNMQDEESYSFKVPNLGSSKSAQEETDRNKENDESKADDDVKCYIYKEDENSAERSFLIKVQDSTFDEDKVTSKVDRRCGPYLIGNLEIMMSELNGTINVWGKEITKTKPPVENSSNNLNCPSENTERRTLRARRTMNSSMICSTEKKQHPSDCERSNYRNSCNHCHENRQRICERVGPASHYPNCFRAMSYCKMSQPSSQQNHCCRQNYYEDSCMHAHDRRHRRYEPYLRRQPKMIQDEDDDDYESEHNYNHNHNYNHSHNHSYDRSHNHDKNTECPSKYCCTNQEHSTHYESPASTSNMWQTRSSESMLYNGKIDSGVHSDTLSNQGDDTPYTSATGLPDINKVRKRRTPVKSFLDLLKSCSGDVQSSSQSRNIPRVVHSSPSTSNMVQDMKNEANYIHTELDRRIREHSENNCSRSNAVLKMVKNRYSEPHGN